MSALRQRLKSPGTYLAVVALCAGSLAIDAAREPRRQLSARAYIALVEQYQGRARPLLEGRIRCRYQPTCSRYSIEAVREHGIAPGLLLSAKRLASCRRSVPLGTEDPVPARRPRAIEDAASQAGP